MSNKNLDNYFGHIWKKSGIKRELPFPNAKPLFSSTGEGLENRKASHAHAKKVLDWNRKRLKDESSSLSEE